ncbi:MAG: NrsF family protein [Hyphomicrobiales bacterium]|nr:NrsF family protein [Hyphomicrobiales bacterium]
MRTEDLIDGLARQAGEQASPVENRFGLAEAAGVTVAVGLFLAVLGPRADFADAINTPWYPIKLLIMGGLAALAFPVVTALARPGASVPATYLLLAAAALAAAMVADLVLVGADGASGRMFGRNATSCMTFIPIFATAPFLAAFIALRHGAPTRPGLTGAAVGLFCGAIGGFLYGIFCPDDSPLFVVVWYSLAIAIVAAAGFIVGRLALRW